MICIPKDPALTTFSLFNYARLRLFHVPIYLHRSPTHRGLWTGQSQESRYLSAYEAETLYLSHVLTVEGGIRQKAHLSRLGAGGASHQVGVQLIQANPQVHTVPSRHAVSCHL